MDNKTEQDDILKQALELDADQRAHLITQINDSELRHHIEGIINDQKNITQFFDQDKTLDKSGRNQKPKELKSGTKINRITIEKLLGKGGMGSVYQGYDEKLKRKVAIKSIRSEYLKVESTHQRFIREAQILSKINHPSICHIYDYIETDSRDYLVLELIQGKQLNQVFLDYDALLKVILELAKALEAAHKHGIVHRDLKPDNIMITADHQVKVLDFGIAQSLSNPLAIKSKVDKNKSSELTKQGSLVGTIRYMSPEQARGEKISTASDIYSLGIIIQELFSHENAYEATETVELLESVQKGQTADYTCTYKSIRNLIQKLCHLPPENRPSATDVCVEVENILMAPKIRIKRRIQIISLLLVSALIVVMAWQWQQSQFQNNSAELAKTYTNNINQLVRESEQIYVLPLHNTRPEIEHVLQKGAELYMQIDNDPLLTKIEKMQLHGLIYLESEDYETAVEFLEKSEANNTLLARAWIGLYIEKVSDYALEHGISNALEATEIRQNYLTPAINYINRSTQKDAVHEAFKVSLTKSLDAGLILLDEIILAQSWDKKAIKLKTLLLLTQAEKALQEGDWETAKNLFKRTTQTFEQAINMARSYPDSYLGLCQVNNVMLFDGIQRTGKNIEQHAIVAIQACKDYLTAYPDDDFTINLLSRIHAIVAQDDMLHDRSPVQSIESAQFWSEQSQDNNIDSTALWTKALLHSIKASYALSKGLLDDGDINQAIALYKKAIFYSPIQAYLRIDLIQAYSLQAEILVRYDKDISSIINDAEFIFQQSLNHPSILASDKRSLFLNMGAVYYVQLGNDYFNDKNIDKKGEDLLEIFRLATNDLLDEPKILINIATVHLLLAQSQVKAPDTAYHHLELAKESLLKVQNINTQYPQLLTRQLWLESLTSQIDNNKYPDVELHFEKSNATLPNNAQIYYLWANHYWLKIQKTTNQKEKNNLKQNGLLKIREALSRDSTNKFYLNLKKKLSI